MIVVMASNSNERADDVPVGVVDTRELALKLIGFIGEPSEIDPQVWGCDTVRTIDGTPYFFSLVEVQWNAINIE